MKLQRRGGFLFPVLVLLVLPLLALFQNFTGTSPTSTVVITSLPVSPLAPGFSGYNTVSQLSPVPYSDPTFTSLTKTLQPGVLRWPGGTMTDYFNWQTGLPGTQSQFSRWSMLQLYQAVYPAAFCATSPLINTDIMMAKGPNFLIDPNGGPDFVSFAKSVGAKSIIIDVNTLTDSPSSAYQLAQMVALNKVPVAMFSLGNEPQFVYPTSSSAAACQLPGGLPTTNLPNWIQAATPLTDNYDRAIQYATRMAVYAQQISAGYASGGGDITKLKIAMPAGFINNGKWMTDWLNGLNSYVATGPKSRYWNAVDLHDYPASNSASFATAMQAANQALAENLATPQTTGVLQVLMAQPWASGLPLMISEYNASLGNQSMNGSFYSGIYSAEYLMRLSNIPGVSVLNVAQHVLTGTGIVAPANYFQPNSAGMAWNGYLAGLGAAGQLFNYSAFNTQNPLFISAEAVGVSVANNVFKNSDGVYPTVISNSGLPSLTLADGTVISAVYAQAYRDSKSQMTRVLLTNKSAELAKLNFSVDGVSPSSISVMQVSSADPSVVYSAPPSPSPLPAAFVRSGNLVALAPYSVTEVQIPWVIPSATQDPQSQAIDVGGSFTLSAVFSGLPAPAVQWYFNGAAIAGATANSYTVSGASLAAAGTYYAVATNPAGSAQSASASVSVAVVPPTVASFSVPSAAVVGSVVKMSVTATGTPPFSYQWYYQKTPISGANGSTYRIPSAALTNTGNYHVQVSNSAGSSSSTWSYLTVYSQ